MFCGKKVGSCYNRFFEVGERNKSISWRVAGVVELGSMENICAGDRTVGSNPTLSAILTDLVMLSGEVAVP